VGRLSAEAPVSVWAFTRTAQPGAPSNSLPEHEGLGVSQEFRGNCHEASSESTPTRQARVYIALHASQSSPRRIARLTGAVAMAGPADEPEQNKLKRVALSKPKFNVDRIKIS